MPKTREQEDVHIQMNFSTKSSEQLVAKLNTSGENSTDRLPDRPPDSLFMPGCRGTHAGTLMTAVPATPSDKVGGPMEKLMLAFKALENWSSGGRP